MEETDNLDSLLDEQMQQYERTQERYRLRKQREAKWSRRLRAIIRSNKPQCDEKCTRTVVVRIDPSQQRGIAIDGGLERRCREHGTLLEVVS